MNQEGIEFDQFRDAQLERIKQTIEEFLTLKELGDGDDVEQSISDFSSKSRSLEFDLNLYMLLVKLDKQSSRSAGKLHGTMIDILSHICEVSPSLKPIFEEQVAKIEALSKMDAKEQQTEESKMIIKRTEMIEQMLMHLYNSSYAAL